MFGNGLKVQTGIWPLAQRHFSGTDVFLHSAFHKKIPNSTDIGQVLRFLKNIFFLTSCCQTAGHQKIHLTNICSNAAWDPELFPVTSMSRRASEPKSPFGDYITTFNKKRKSSKGELWNMIGFLLMDKASCWNSGLLPVAWGSSKVLLLFLGLQSLLAPLLPSLLAPLLCLPLMLSCEVCWPPKVQFSSHHQFVSLDLKISKYLYSPILVYSWRFGYYMLDCLGGRSVPGVLSGVVDPGVISIILMTQTEVCSCATVITAFLLSFRPASFSH